jgi:Flp pilus assembly protein TadG
MRIGRRGEARRGGRSGAALVEMAVVFPLLVAMILGMVEMARLGMVAQLLSTAAREGCRVAVIQGKTQADVQARVNAVLAGSKINVGTVTPTPSNWATASTGTAVTVSLSVPYSQVTWLPVPKFLAGATVRAAATMNAERP